MDVESFYEGYLAHIIVQAGDTATVGSAIAYVAETEAEIETAKSLGISGSTAATPSSAPEPVAATASVEIPALASQNGSNHREGRLVASPRARKLAKELKVDLSNLQGSGPYGRIVAEDVEAAVNQGKQPATAPVASSRPAQTTPVALPPQTAAPVPTPAVAAVPGQTVPLTTFQNAPLFLVKQCL